MTVTTNIISADDLAAIVGRPDCPQIFDVRRREVFEVADSIIAGAKWRDHRETADWGLQLSKSADVLVYCVHGHQVSQGAAAQLRAMGVNARYLEGGIEAFVAVGGTTIAKTGAVGNNGQ